MAYHHLVMTAGISAFAPQNLGRTWLDTEFPARLQFAGPAVDAQPGERESILAQAPSRPLPRVVERGRVSAEFSMVQALRAAGALTSRPRIDLVHTQTFAGNLAAIFAARTLEEAFDASVTCHPIPDLDASRPADMRASLGAFMERLARCMAGCDPRATCFAPIGGFKVMTSLGYLTGALFGFETLYLHEVGQRLVRVPAVPLDIQIAALVEARPLVWRILDHAGGMMALSELDPEERAVVERYPWMFEEADLGGDAFLAVGPFGLLLKATPRFSGALARRVFVARGAVGPVREATQAIRSVLDELDRSPRREELLFHERSFGHHAAHWHAYRTASNGRFRLLWRLGAPDRVEIRRIWVDNHRAYEREVEAGDALRGEVENLVEFFP